MSRKQTKEEAVQRVAIRVRMGKAQALPFPVYYADHISTREGPHGTVQVTFHYVPVLDALFDAVTPDDPVPSERLTAEAYVATQVVVPASAFETWFRDLAESRGLLPEPGEGGDESA